MVLEAPHREKSLFISALKSLRGVFSRPGSGRGGNSFLGLLAEEAEVSQ